MVQETSSVQNQIDGKMDTWTDEMIPNKEWCTDGQTSWFKYTPSPVNFITGECNNSHCLFQLGTNVYNSTEAITKLVFKHPMYTESEKMPTARFLWRQETCLSYIPWPHYVAAWSHPHNISDCLGQNFSRIMIFSFTCLTPLRTWNSIKITRTGLKVLSITE